MKNDRIEIGEVLLVQVQRVPLKQGDAPDRYYDPSGLVRLPEIRLTPDGVVGISVDGEEVIDAHHKRHPQSRFKGVNGISVGFTAHYERMQRRYGDHLENGIAGENLVILSDIAYTAGDLAGCLVFVNPDGSECCTRMYKAMAPCNEFSRFAQRATGRISPSVLKETLQDLDGGRRGFAILLAGDESGVVRTGARVYLERD